MTIELDRLRWALWYAAVRLEIMRDREAYGVSLETGAELALMRGVRELLREAR